MAKKFDQLRSQLSPKAQQRANKTTRDMLAQMPLQELRQAKKLSQEKSAELLHVKAVLVREVP